MKIQEVEEAIEILESSDRFNEKTKVCAIDKEGRNIRFCISNDGWYIASKEKILKRCCDTTVTWGVAIEDLSRIADAYVRDIGVTTPFYRFIVPNRDSIYFDNGSFHFCWDKERDIIVLE